jgi:hypothetical protein
MLENGVKQQEEYYRKAMSDLTKQHKEHFQAIFKRNEETERSFMVNVGTSCSQKKKKK